MGWFGELCKDNAGHAGVDEDPNDALDAHDHDGNWALGRRRSAAVPDGVLRFKTEEEGGCEVFNIFDTNNMVVRALLSRN